MAEITRLPGPVADLWDWQLDGACRRVGPEVFFHPEGERGTKRRTRASAAKEICLGCPVLQQCRSHALSGARAVRGLGRPHRGRARVVLLARAAHRILTR